MSQLYLTDPFTSVRAKVTFPEGSVEVLNEPPRKNAAFLLPEGWGALEFRVCVPNPDVLAVKAKRMEARADFDQILSEMPEDERAATEKKRPQVYQNIDSQLPLPRESYVYRTIRLPVLSPESVEKVLVLLAGLGVTL